MEAVVSPSTFLNRAWLLEEIRQLPLLLEVVVVRFYSRHLLFVVVRAFTNGETLQTVNADSDKALVFIAVY